MLTMLLIRPGTAWLMLYCLGLADAVHLQIAASRADTAGQSTPPGRIGCGAYGASVAGPGVGNALTARGAVEVLRRMRVCARQISAWAAIEYSQASAKGQTGVLRSIISSSDMTL